MIFIFNDVIACFFPHSNDFIAFQTRQVLVSLSENGVRAALLWDAKKRVPICCVTATDLLRIMCTHFGSAQPKANTTLPVSYPSISNERSQSPNPGTINQSGMDFTDVLKQPILSNLIKAGNAKGKVNKRCTLITVAGGDT